jgi:pimeloyl-ACP methyl ester carboxylesterase
VTFGGEANDRSAISALAAAGGKAIAVAGTGPGCRGGRTVAARTWAAITGCAAPRYGPIVPVTLSYDVAGTGPALVLLHSTVCDRRMWDPQWPVLADAGYRVVRCDFRGYGETPVPQGPYNDAEDVLELVGELGVGPVAVVGASYGGKVALEIAARWPQQVTALVLACAGMPGHEPTDALRGFWQREGELIEAGDIAGAVELNVATWLGPQASQATRGAGAADATPRFRGSAGRT